MGAPILSQTNNILFNTMFVVLNMCMFSYFALYMGTQQLICSTLPVLMLTTSLAPVLNC